MENLGGECVFASEIDDRCVEVYKNNYNIDSKHDITKTDEKDIPTHDVLCGGFPCQAFSKAGKQMGINDARGTLFFDIARILKYHHTKYIILENVKNLVSHDNGNTWKTIKRILIDIGYKLTPEPLILSPHQFGVPQVRERVFILGVYDPEHCNEPLEISLPNLLQKEDNSIYSILDKDKQNELSEYELNLLEIWNEFHEIVKKESLGFPIWTSFFGKKPNANMPKWKQDYIIKNNKLYEKYKSEIDLWLEKHNQLKDLTPTHRKFEWQAGKNVTSIYDAVIQFRPSGVRVKKPDVFPALVAIVQIPIIGKYKRRLSPRECARLQSFPEQFIYDKNDHFAFKQFGNSANVKIIQTLGKELFTK